MNQTLIKNINIWTMDERDSRFFGWILLENGRIASMGEGETPDCENVIDGEGGVLTPGLIDIHSHIGLYEDGLGFEGADGNEDTDPATPHLRALDGVNPFDRSFREALEAGVTAAAVSPGSANPIGGQIALLKTAGRRVDDMILKAPLAIKFALGENPKSVYHDKDETPVTRMATAGIIRENPVLRLVLGCCSALAVTTTVSGAVGMGLAMTFVLVCSNIVISALRKVIPAKVHLPCYIVIIATFVTVVQMVLQAFVPDLYKALGVYLALIVVNCIILGRAEMFACKNTVVDSALDGLGMGIGYILTMLLMSSIREIIGSGTWMGITIIPESVDRMTVMNSAPGGFFVFGCLMAGCVWLERKLNKPIERKSCGDVMLEKIDAAKEEQKEGAAQ